MTTHISQLNQSNVYGAATQSSNGSHWGKKGFGMMGLSMPNPLLPHLMPDIPPH